MTIRPVTNRQEWVAFLAAHPVPTFLQAWEWGDCQQALGHTMFPLGAYEGSKLIAVTMIIKTVAKRGSFLSTSHGPIIDSAWSKPIQYQKVLKELTSYITNLARQEHCAFIRVLPAASRSEEITNIFRSLGYREAPLYLHSENAWLLDLVKDGKQKTDDELIADMRKTTRYLIRKAERDGVIIEKRTDEQAIDDFWTLYEKTVEREKFTGFSKRYIEEEFKAFHASGNALFLFGKESPKSTEYLAASLILFTSSAGCYHQGASVHTKVPVTYLMQWEAIKEARTRGCQYYSFWGIAPTDDPKHPWAGLTLFKKGFGGRQMDFTKTQDYPLSWLYYPTALYEKLIRLKRGL